MDELMGYISKTYSLGPLQMLEKVALGVLSNNYVLTDGKTKYFLKCYRITHEQKIKQVHQAKYFFAHGGIPVILPVKFQEQSYFFFNNGYWALFPFVAGRQIVRSQLTNTALVSMAKTLARMHFLGATATFDVEARNSFWDKKVFLEQASDILSRIMAQESKVYFDELSIRNLNLKISLATQNTLHPDELPLPSDHVLHGDYHEGNMFFDESDQVRYVFDFEQSGRFARVNEVIRSMDYVCINGIYSEENLKRARLYFSTYTAEYPLSRQEITNGFKVYFLKKVHDLWIEKEHYLNNNFRPDVYMQRNYDSLKYLSEEDLNYLVCKGDGVRNHLSICVATAAF